MKKMLGYLLAILGLATLALTVEQIKKFIPFSIPAGITNTMLFVAGGILIFLGVAFVLGARRGGPHASAGSEIPIYHGDKLVGYRRH